MEIFAVEKTDYRGTLTQGRFFDKKSAERAAELLNLASDYSDWVVKPYGVHVDPMEFKPVYYAHVEFARSTTNFTGEYKIHEGIVEELLTEAPANAIVPFGLSNGTIDGFGGASFYGFDRGETRDRALTMAHALDRQLKNYLANRD